MASESREGSALTVWVDAQLPPAMAVWLNEFPEVIANHTFDLGFLHADDTKIWDAARAAKAIIITKDADFKERVERLGAPPQVVWVTVGNVSNRSLRELIRAVWPRAATLLRSGEPLVELAER